MWMDDDLCAYRKTHQWRIEETDECLFLVDASLPIPSSIDMRRLFAMTDQLHLRIRDVLEIDSNSLKLKEKLRKVNVWLYASEILEQAVFVNPERLRQCYGTANAAGLHLVTHEVAWDNPEVIEVALHEAVHLCWADQVGSAPSLLNEGMAVYVESMLGANAAYESSELHRCWQAYATSAGPGFLRRLCRDEVFWSQDAAREPVFMVGGHLISFLIDTYGMPSLRSIFLKSHLNDPMLADHMDDVIGEPLDRLERQVSEWTGSK